MKNYKAQANRLIEQYGRCLTLSNKLEIALQKLSWTATILFGEELRSDICAGGEIEFRRIDMDGYINASSTILIKDIINKLKQDYHFNYRRNNNE